MPARLEPVDELALLGVAEPLARELARVDRERLDVRDEPRVVADVLEQLLRFGRELGRVARLLGFDAPIRSVVGIDELVGVLPEPQAELDVATGGAQRSDGASPIAASSSTTSSSGRAASSSCVLVLRRSGSTVSRWCSTSSRSAGALP